MKFFSHLAIPIVILVVIIFAGAEIYSQVEGWRYLDSVYFTVITVTTIGYGDFVPQTDTGKIFTIFFSFAGIGMAFYFFSLTGRYIFSKHLRDRLIDSGRLNGKRGVRRVKR